MAHSTQNSKLIRMVYRLSGFDPILTPFDPILSILRRRKMGHLLNGARYGRSDKCKPSKHAKALTTTSVEIFFRSVGI